MYMLIISILGSAAFSNFLDDCFSAGMLLEKYGRWVKDGTFWKKPLGGCIYCMNVWMAIAFYLGTFNDVSLNVISGLGVIGVSNTILKLFVKNNI